MGNGDSSIEVGGEGWLAEYPRYYFEAARKLLNSSDGDLASVALPLVYLQRHCLELMIKDIHLASSFLAAAKLMATGKLVTPERPENKHCLVDLVGALRESLRENGASMPPDLEPLAREMDALEASSPDRYRYAFQFWTKPQKKAGQGPEESFPTAQRLPVKEIQARLELLVSEADIRNEASLIFRLYSDCTTTLNGAVTFDPEIFA